MAEPLTPSGHLPPQLMSAVLDEAPPLVDAVRALVAPVHQERQAIRDHLLACDAIMPLPTDRSLYLAAAVDGAYTLTPLMAGDHLCTLAVGVRSTMNPNEQANDGVEITQYRTWADFQAHGPDGDTLTTAVMMSHELDLLRTFDPDRNVAIIDGSHATALTALNTAMASPDPRVREQVLALADEGLLEAVEYASTTPTVVACPKSDSSTTLWETCSQELHLQGTAIPDKVLASVALEPGEMLAGGIQPRWQQLHASRNWVRHQDVEPLAARLDEASKPLREQNICVYHAKPAGAATAVRIELKASVDDFEAYDLIQGVCQDTAPPYLQEPVVQHLADRFAKGVSTTTDVQMATARLDLMEAGETEYLEHLLRYYRTAI